VKRLNFYPYYEPYLRARQKTTTLRLHKPMDLQEGEQVILSVGWDEKSVVDLHRAKIRKIYPQRVDELSMDDLEGESPDCTSADAARLVLSSIYRIVVRGDDEIWVVKFDHA
jgi:hypothetical protein